MESRILGNKTVESRILGNKTVESRILGNKTVGRRLSGELLGRFCRPSSPDLSRFVRLAWEPSTLKKLPSRRLEVLCE